MLGLWLKNGTARILFRHPPPFSFQVEPGDPFLQGGPIQQFAGDGQHGPDVAQMFFGAAFAVVFKLAKDDVFRRGQHNRFTFKIRRSFASKRPGIQFVAPGQVEIGFEPCVQVNDAEMAALAARNLRQNGFGRRKIKFALRKSQGQFLDVARVKEHDKINVVGQAWLTLEDRGHAAADHIANARAIQRPDKQQE